MEEMIAHYEDIKRNTIFRQLINIKQKGLVGEHIEDFQKLNIRVTDIPNRDMRKFDCKDLITWILQMEQYFEIHNTQNKQKVRIETLYL